jgi:energy-coupling factor transporter ATP-binding protein EcfA2
LGKQYSFLDHYCKLVENREVELEFGGKEMELLRKADNLTEAYQLLDPARPLEGRWMKRFYAERPVEASITPLMDEILLDPNDDDKTIFTGHRGSGKSTELARLEQSLEDTHTVVRFNVEGLLNLGDVDYTDLMVVLGLQVFQKARAAGFELDEKKLDDLLFWYTTHIFEEDEVRKIESEMGGELNAVFARFSAKLSTNAPKRKMVRAEAQANLSDLLERLNALLQYLTAESDCRVIAIVDGLDKIYDRNQVRDLFCQGANALLEPRCRIIYTVPLAIYNTNDFQQVRMSFPRNFALPNIKTMEQDGTDSPEGREALLQVLDRRLMPSLVTQEAANRLVNLCGGLMKELISLTRNAVLHARRLQGERGPVRVEDVEYAARQVRNTFRSHLTQEQYLELWRIYKGGTFVNSEVARDLLHNLSLLEYNGGDAWWRIHPIVRPLLDERADELENSEKEKHAENSI